MLVFFINATAKNYLQLNGDYYVMKSGWSHDYHAGMSCYKYFDIKKTFLHPSKFDKLSMGSAIVNFFNTVVKGHSEL